MTTTNVAPKLDNQQAKLSTLLAQHWRLATCIIIPTLLLLVPAPAGLTVAAWQLFAIYTATILGFILRPYDEPVVILGVIAVSSLFLGNGSVVLSGYSSPVVWLVFSAFMIGAAIIETGLGRRIAYFLIGAVGKSTLSLGYVAAITDLALAPATPSNTARSGGIVYPIIRSVAVSLGSTPGDSARKVGAYLTVLLYSISLTTGYIFLTAIAPNLLMVKLGESILKTKVDWFLWFKAAALPGFLCLVLLPLAVYIIYPPDLKTYDNKAVAAAGRSQLGPMSWKEYLLAVFFVAAILAWATGSWTGIDATTVAIGLVAASLLTGIVSWDRIVSNKSAWSTLIWYGGIVGIADGLAKAKFFDWFAKLLSENISLTGYDPVLVMAVLVVFSLVMHYLFASLAAFITAMLPVLFTLAVVANTPIYPTFFLLAFATDYGASLTHFGGALGPVLFGERYVDQKTWWKIGALLTTMSFIIHMAVGLPYWKWLGLW